MNKAKEIVTIVLNGLETNIPKSDLEWFKKEKGAYLKGEDPNPSEEDEEEKKRQLYLSRKNQLEAFKNSEDLLKELSEETNEEDYSALLELGKK